MCVDVKDMNSDITASDWKELFMVSSPDRHVSSNASVLLHCFSLFSDIHIQCLAMLKFGSVLLVECFALVFGIIPTLLYPFTTHNETSSWEILLEN